MTVQIGTAGWSIPRDCAAQFPGEGQHLQRYAGVLGVAEINSSFHRPHQPRVYARWAAMTPPGFRFSAKLPRAITHEGRLRRARAPLQQFLGEAAGLGDKLAVLLVQLPPSLAYEARPVRSFFTLLASLFRGAVVCEPRHASWFTPGADAALAGLRVSRAAADPARWPAAAVPGGWLGPRGDGGGALLYHRWHGAPRIYWSRYEEAWLQQRADELRAWPADAQPWCIFDNTAGGGAAANALRLRQLLAGP
ncbi:DUF72 domain-containing protein [Aquincola sp. J276]|uniref:DUF72 domain-containing protein n=1 Tax=Aquincola sp. J276 TaxID=2898432 RepID=UPI0021511F98|nr:DUF72 domain-containing protein [Aquincola sp. J276]MCR5864152.1 DUF72 domain-containing protein [Aquincola sp. J276]